MMYITNHLNYIKKGLFHLKIIKFLKYLYLINLYHLFINIFIIVFLILLFTNTIFIIHY